MSPHRSPAFRPYDVDGLVSASAMGSNPWCGYRARLFAEVDVTGLTCQKPLSAAPRIFSHVVF
jgi:hypothetical protein